MAAALLLHALSPALAQARFNAGLGAVVPVGSSADVLNPGYNAMLSFTIRPNWMRNHLRFEYALNTLTDKSAGSPKHQIASGAASVIIVGAQRAGPAGYVVMGVGTYQNSGSAGRSSDPGFNVGAGIRFGMGFFGSFVEARLHYVADDAKTKYFPMTFGLTF